MPAIVACATPARTKTADTASGLRKSSVNGRAPRSNAPSSTRRTAAPCPSAVALAPTIFSPSCGYRSQLERGPPTAGHLPYRRSIVPCVCFDSLRAGTPTRGADEMANGEGPREREWALLHRHVDLRRALVLAHVLTPSRRAERLHEPPGLRHVLIQLPTQRAVATADRGQLPHGRHERLGVFAGDLIFDDDENGAVTILWLHDHDGVLPVAGRPGLERVAIRQRKDPP